MTMSTVLLDAKAQIQQGVEAILARLESLDQAEHDAADRVDALAQKEAQVAEKLAATRGVLKDEAAKLGGAIAAIGAAKDKADAILKAAKEESARLIDEANAKCGDIGAQREAARVALAEMQKRAEAAEGEWKAIQAKIAQAKENFLRA